MGVKIRNYMPATYTSPADGDIVVFSDLSGDEIDGEVWSVDGDLASEQEAYEYFMESYTSLVPEEEYEKAKRQMIQEYRLTEADFEDHPDLRQTEMGNDIYYDFDEGYDPYELDYLPNDDIYPVDENDLVDMAEEDDEREDYLSNQADDYNDEEWVRTHFDESKED